MICHASAVEVAVDAARRLKFETSELGPPSALKPPRPTPIDLLCYGRASGEQPAPPGARMITPSIQEGGSPGEAIRLLATLRRRRYDLVALAQPALGLSRARGLLVSYCYLASTKRAVILDPVAQRTVRGVNLRMALGELARWLSLRILATAAAALSVRPLLQLASREEASRQPLDHGAVPYLRTDIDLRVSPLTAGGSVAHTEGILQALLDRGYRVAYLGTGTVDGIPRTVPQMQLPVLLKGNLPTEIAELISGIAQGWMLRRRGLAESGQPIAFVYQRYSLNNLAGVILSRRLGVPLLLEANGSEAKWRQDFGSLSYPRLAYACEKLILRRSATITAVSKNAAEDIVASGAPPQRVRVVPNGVSVRRFARATPMPLPGDLNGKFVVAFVGLFYPWHGVRVLAEAFALLHARRPEARLLLVGDGEERPLVRSVLERHSVLDAAHFTGLVPRSDAPRYMASADVLASPHADVDHFIGSPIKAFEYMAAGKPILATRVGQLQELLVDGETALLVEPGNPPAMAAALDRLAADPSLRERLGRAAQEEAILSHSWDSRLAAILDRTDEP